MRRMRSVSGSARSRSGRRSPVEPLGDEQALLGTRHGAERRGKERKRIASVDCAGAARRNTAACRARAARRSASPRRSRARRARSRPQEQKPWRARPGGGGLEPPAERAVRHEEIAAGDSATAAVSSREPPSATSTSLIRPAVAPGTSAPRVGTNARSESWVAMMTLSIGMVSAGRSNAVESTPYGPRDAFPTENLGWCLSLTLRTAARGLTAV